MTLDVPDEVRSQALADGHAAWLDGLPSVLESLARDWSLTIGATMRGGHAALVVEATLADGTPSVLKVAVPGYRRLTPQIPALHGVSPLRLAHIQLRVMHRNLRQFLCIKYCVVPVQFPEAGRTAESPVVIRVGVRRRAWSAWPAAVSGGEALTPVRVAERPAEFVLGLVFDAPLDSSDNFAISLPMIALPSATGIRKGRLAPSALARAGSHSLIGAGSSSVML
jgi:hypothetical protein